MARIVVIHEQGVVESAGDDQPRKGAQPGEPALAFILVQAGMATARGRVPADRPALVLAIGDGERSEEHTYELQSLLRISYAVFCLNTKKHTNNRLHY